MHQLQPLTEPGRALVALTEELAAVFAETAADHDRDGTYPEADIEALRDRGYLVAPVPEALGGLGVESVHDLLVAASRLAAGHASVAIGASMHLIPLVNIAHRRRVALRSGEIRRAEAFGQSLEAVARERMVLASAVSEPGQNLTRPSTVARRTGDGWRVDGRKIFCTMSPVATHLYASVRFEDESGEERYGYARIPTETSGVTIHHDWDALGMRASGSHSVTFDDVHLPLDALRGGFPTGGFPTGWMERNLVAGAFHAATSLGIAEFAQAEAIRGLRHRGLRGVGSRARMLLAENSIELEVLRASLARAGAAIDRAHARVEDAAEVTPDDVLQDFAGVQAAKTFANHAAVRIVDRALATSGGAGYMARHPLARAYRDVRAGAFMHPLGADRAYELLADVAVGRQPALN